MDKLETLKKIKSLMHAETSLLAFNQSFREETDKQSCDKFGAGFNRDLRFSAFSAKVSFDSWTGYYGSSGCSKFGPNLSGVDGGDYLIEALNQHKDLIFKTMADLIKNDYVNMLTAAKDELKQANDLISSIEADHE